ncbi:uncharacterized protein EV420DRAFT_1586531 [Desarmillaria tabescens]|uniref:Uncharacterized protein n=1 Tax=Armillaria tabescens TaxID=1929756 RepID=A0AA39JAC7_ARMTA|nr:uncharacterized protein EV420DRAFT_1586531 [Desarmillaria tabescens]KAK0438146.1 hypothetical protein EV420DRAFT_1586531 [Desarmillaria tabescens]
MVRCIHIFLALWLRGRSREAPLRSFQLRHKHFSWLYNEHAFAAWTVSKRTEKDHRALTQQMASAQGRWHKLAQGKFHSWRYAY